MLGRTSVVLFAVLLSAPAVAGTPKLDKETCDQLKAEQATFATSGIAADFQKGPVWAKANLPPERLREIEHYILLDEQLKFGCRQVTISNDALRAGEEAVKLEATPNLDFPDKATDEGETKGGPDAKPGLPQEEKKPAKKPHGEKRSDAGEGAKAVDAYSPPPAAKAGSELQPKK